MFVWNNLALLAQRVEVHSLVVPARMDPRNDADLSWAEQDKVIAYLRRDIALREELDDRRQVALRTDMQMDQVFAALTDLGRSIDILNGKGKGKGKAKEGKGAQKGAWSSNCKRALLFGSCFF